MKPLEFPPNPPNFPEPPAPPKPRWIKEGVAVDPRILADSDNGKKPGRSIEDIDIDNEILLESLSKDSTMRVLLDIINPTPLRKVRRTLYYGTPQTREHKFWSFLNQYSYVRINFSLIPEFLRTKLLNKVSETARY